MAPLTPHWSQPSHPSIQKVLVTSEKEFTTKSISLVDLPPYALYAKLTYPPCTKAEKPTYATVQVGQNEHLDLNSDLVYVNHGCEPSVIFDTTSFSILAGPHGLTRGQELTFFYPSTEWDMAQGFHCFCGAGTCRGWISGAKNMSAEQLEGVWLNAHIREMLEERDGLSNSAVSGVKTGHEAREGKNGVKPIALVDSAPVSENGTMTGIDKQDGNKDVIEEALELALIQARKMVDAAQKALDTYKSIHGHETDSGSKTGSEKGANRQNGVGSREMSGEMGGDTGRGVTSRELSGEMGGDTSV